MKTSKETDTMEQSKVVLVNCLGFTIYVDIKIIEDDVQKLEFTLFRDKNLGLKPYTLMNDQKLVYGKPPLTKRPNGKIELVSLFNVKFYTDKSIYMQSAIAEDGDFIFFLKSSLPN